MNTISTSRQLFCAGSFRFFSAWCGAAFLLAGGQVLTAADKSVGADKPAIAVAAAPVEVVIPKSVFVDEVGTGRDPFFPKSPRRVKTVAKAPDGTVVVVPPSVAVLGQLTLKGFSNGKNHRLALINGTTFEQGELADVKVGTRTVKVRCREIRDNSVLVSIEGVNETKELKLRDGI